MQELSLNILDIAQNSVSAGASLIQIGVSAYGEDGRWLRITIEDDGALLVQKEDGTMIRLASGEIRVRTGKGEF